MGLSPVAHGQESWFELTLYLKDLRSIVQYQVDAFAKKDVEGNPVAFSGNPAAVILRSLSVELMQLIAMENNLAETAFVSPLVGENCYYNPVCSNSNCNEMHFNIRWFTPCCEIELCGHATLAASHVLFAEERMVDTSKVIVFHTNFGQVLKVRCILLGEYELDFPSIYPVEFIPTGDEMQTIVAALKLEWKDEAVYFGRSSTKYFIELSRVAYDRITYSSSDVNIELLSALDTRGVVVTRMGCKHLSVDDAPNLHIELNSKYDFISRFFAPR